MPDYYIRTPDQDESRGPFDPPKLLTLAEAGQVTENTLYYDELKEEWIPIALNPQLKESVFPSRDKLALRVNAAQNEDEDSDAPKESSGIRIEDMLDAAEGNTEQKKAIKQKDASFQKAATVSASGMGLMMFGSATFLLMPLFDTIKTLIESGSYTQLLNYPFVIVGVVDFLMALLLLLAVTEIYPLARARGMLTLGFGVYVGWTIGDPLVIGLCAASGVGLLLASVAKSLSTMLFALVLGIGGSGYLAYLAVMGRFADFFTTIQFNIISG